MTISASQNTNKGLNFAVTFFLHCLNDEKNISLNLMLTGWLLHFCLRSFIHIVSECNFCERFGSFNKECYSLLRGFSPTKKQNHAFSQTYSMKCTLLTQCLFRAEPIQLHVIVFPPLMLSSVGLWWKKTGTGIKINHNVILQNQLKHKHFHRSEIFQRLHVCLQNNCRRFTFHTCHLFIFYNPILYEVLWTHAGGERKQKVW